MFGFRFSLDLFYLLWISYRFLVELCRVIKMIFIKNLILMNFVKDCNIIYRNIFIRERFKYFKVYL